MAQTATINYTAAKINELLAAIPDKADTSDVSARVEAEAKARQNADDTINQFVTKQVETLTAADTAEAAAREKADTAEQTARAAADTEIMKRLMGTSEYSDGNTDPYVNLGDFSSVADALKAIEARDYSKTAANGAFRFALNGMIVEGFTYIQNYASKNALQTLTGPLGLEDDGTLAYKADNFTTLYRKLSGGTWGAWTDAAALATDAAALATKNAAAITAEETARKEADAAIEAKINPSYVDVLAKADAVAYVDGVSTALTPKRRVRLYPTKSFALAKMWQYGDVNGANIVHADVSHFDTSAFTSLACVFVNCDSLTSIDVSGWDTSKVTAMSYMFYRCQKTTAIDVSGWDTSKVTAMDGLFNGCTALTALDVSGFDTSKVTNMSFMFNGCTALTSVDVSGFDTSKVTNMSYMFGSCTALTALDVSGFDTSKVTNMSYMFNGCRALTTLIGTHTLAEVEAGTCVALSGTSVDLSLNHCTKLDRASLLAVIKGLASVTTAKTLTLGSTNLAKLTDEDKQIATAKGWTLA